jgi:hypothetical protein
VLRHDVGGRPQGLRVVAFQLAAQQLPHR